MFVFIHVIDPVVVGVTVINSNQMSLSWTTPQSVIDQGVSQYQISVTPLCSTGATTATQTFTASPSDPSSITISSLGKLNTDVIDGGN